MCLPVDDSVGIRDTLDSRLPNTNTCKKVYQGLIKKKATLPLKSQDKWMKDTAIAENTTVNWEKKNYFLAFRCTKEIKPREFQARLHRLKSCDERFSLQNRTESV